jgi:membrane protein implicated in regulation of membrane protease activity
MGRKLSWAEIGEANAGAALAAGLAAWAFDLGFWGALAVFDVYLILMIIDLKTRRRRRPRSPRPR